MIKKERDDDGALEFSVAVGDGSTGAEPSTSGLVAIDIARQRSGRLPDLVVSGINWGANIGSFTHVSGTVGSAIVALSSTFNGAVPAIAISTDPVCDDGTPECDAINQAHFSLVAAFLTTVIERLENKPGVLAREPGLLPPLVGLNINYPPVASPAGVLVRQQGLTGMSGGQAVTFNVGCYGACVTLPVGGTLPGGITGFGTDDSPEVRDADSTAFSEDYVRAQPRCTDSSRRHRVLSRHGAKKVALEPDRRSRRSRVRGVTEC